MTSAPSDRRQTSSPPARPAARARVPFPTIYVGVDGSDGAAEPLDGPSTKVSSATSPSLPWSRGTC